MNGLFHEMGAGFDIMLIMLLFPLPHTGNVLDILSLPFIELNRTPIYSEVANDSMIFHVYPGYNPSVT